MKLREKTAIGVVAIWSLVGCSGTQPTTTQPSMEPKQHSASATQPASHQRAGDVESLITAGKLAQADEAYVAYRNGQEGSAKIPGIIIALAQAHLKAGEFLLSRFYCDEYRRDFPSGKRRDAVEYLRLKAAFYHYDRHPDEQAAEAARGEAQHFLSVYGRSLYPSRVMALLERLRLRENARYEALAKYYEGRGKPKAAAIYRAKIR